MPQTEDPKNYIEVPSVRTLKVLYTNDIQGEAQQMALLSTVVKEIRAKEPLTLLVDAGNWAKGTFLSDRFKGLPMAEIMKVIKYEAVGIGLGEIFFGSKNLYVLEEKSGLPLVSANLVESGTGIPPYFLKSFITMEKGPFKIAVTALSPVGEFPGTGFTVLDPMEVLPDIITSVNQYGADVIILLSAMGIEHAREIARRYPRITMIITSGDGVNLQEPIKEGKTFILQAGERVQSLGTFSLDMEATIRISSREAQE